MPSALAARHRTSGTESGVQSIVLICPSLAQGRDGVGDYCYRLAEALAEHGIACSLLALRDRNIDRPVETTKRSTAGAIEVIQLPARLDTGHRFRLAQAALAKWQPDWVSLQMVTYGFKDRGILLDELWWMPRLFAPYRLHVMLHELWIGGLPWSSPKEALVGRLQRGALLKLLKRLAPKRVHTSIPKFQHMLERPGIDASLMPMFGGIDVSDRNASSWLYAALCEQGVSVRESERDRLWIFGIFGGISTNWPADRLLARLTTIAGRAQRRVLIVSIGRITAQATAMVEGWRQRFPEISFAMLGVYPADRISEFLNSVDFCLTSYPFQFIGKSSAAAAALEHGVPVIASWGYTLDGANDASPDGDPLVWREDEELETKLRTAVRRPRIYDAPGQRVRQLLDALKASR